MEPLAARRLERRLIALFGGLSLALSGAVVFLLVERQRADPRRLRELALESDQVREAALAELVGRSEGVWDSFPDPDVGRVMQRGIEGRDFRGVPVSSNEFGMREAPYAAQKPAGTTRVVLLGDSFVFGYGVAEEERVGAFLESFLEERTDGGQLEVLHLAASSWNVLAEASYLRRQLHLLRPDLVVHVVVVNDLDDVHGVRGFGSLSGTSPQVPRRVGGLVGVLSPPGLWPRRLQTYLLYGLDHESRERYRRAAGELARLAELVEAQGGRYVMLAAWESFNPSVGKFLAPALRPDQVAYVSTAFTQELAYRLGPSDRHWNRAGHERIAKLIYGLAVERDLLPELALEPWPAARRVVREVHDVGALEAGFGEPRQLVLARSAHDQVRTWIDFTDLDREGAKQVHGGIFGPGYAAPYVSLVLARGEGDELVVSGERLHPWLLEGGEARVAVEGVPVGTLALAGEELEFERRWPLPAEAREQAFVTVSLESDDYLYTDPASGDSASLQLERVAIEPARE